MLWTRGMNKQYGGATTNTPDFAQVKESVKTLVDHGGEAVNEIKSQISEVSTEARDKASAAYGELVKFVNEHPGKSVALAFGIGYVAMRIRTNFLFPFVVIGGLGLLVKRKLAA
ncbi:MAG: hypothetical protein H0T42_09590 [Deltaproteobacteria bacterium]|nr:hypothetical protein [Deltaproteobacteria bacterium]